ncbi:hypothetical protein GOB87_12550 [Acetobacter estunensis]|uniref:Uncharacterized protein n=2 Tax=Acetobacter estunensis TaxID=104097 RepID=A0A967B8C8_9PROT|nr:hypothetical protein [Acetobacter estunensis]
MLAANLLNEVPALHFGIQQLFAPRDECISEPAIPHDFLRPSQWRELGVEMAGKGINAAYICAALSLNRFELDALVREAGVSLNRAPLPQNTTNHSWCFGDLARLTRQWLAGSPIKNIASSLGRTVRSVKSKRAALGLPPRLLASWKEADANYLATEWSRGTPIRHIAAALKRTVRSVSSKRRRMSLPALPGAIPTDPSIVLTWEQASRLTPDERCGRRWMVKDSPSQLVIGFKKNRGARKSPMVTAWTQEMENELAYRHFANQAPSAIAEAFLLSERTIVSRSSWLHLPRRRKKELRADYDPTIAPIRIAELDYIQRECLGKTGFFFWTPRRNGRRISRRHKQSQIMRSAV